MKMQKKKKKGEGFRPLWGEKKGYTKPCFLLITLREEREAGGKERRKGGASLLNRGERRTLGHRRVSAYGRKKRERERATLSGLPRGKKEKSRVDAALRSHRRGGRKEKKSAIATDSGIKRRVPACGHDPQSSRTRKRGEEEASGEGKKEEGKSHRELLSHKQT